MDNVTHSLVGIALSRAGLHRVCPHAATLLVLSANAPDLDILGLAGGGLRYFEVHRGYSHALVAMPALAIVVMLVVAAIFRQPMVWWRALVLCLIGLSSHLLLDFTNSYGIRLLLPFSARWFFLDLNNLYDAVVLAVLSLAWVWPWFSRLVSGEIGARPSRGQGIARFALLFFVLFDCTRGLLHQRAIQQLESRIYDEAAPLAVAALPDAFNPLSWTGLVESARARYVYEPNPRGDLASGNPQQFLKLPQTKEIFAARQQEPFRFFTYFARFPVWTEEPVQLGESRGRRIEMTDLRFGRPGTGVFHSYALVGAQGLVSRAWFSYQAEQ
jgi:inner membrane protein